MGTFVPNPTFGPQDRRSGGVTISSVPLEVKGETGSGSKVGPSSKLQIWHSTDLMIEPILAHPDVLAIRPLINPQHFSAASRLIIFGHSPQIGQLPPLSRGPLVSIRRDIDVTTWKSAIAMPDEARERLMADLLGNYRISPTGANLGWLDLEFDRLISANEDLFDLPLPMEHRRYLKNLLVRIARDRLVIERESWPAAR